MANRYSQLIALTPKGSFYGASGVILPLRDQAYDFLFAPVPALHTFAIFDNDNASGTTTSDGLGRAIVSLVLEQGFHRITIIDDFDGAKFNSYVTVRVSATAQIAHAEAIEQIDTANQQIQDSLALQTATPNFIEDVFGKSLKQPNDFGTWVTDSYRRMLRWMRQAFRLFGSKLTGLRQATAAYTSSVPLRVPRSWRPWWRLGTQLMPNGNMQSFARTTASPLTNLNARSVNYVHAAYSGGAANIFPGPIANPPNGAEVLRIRFTIGWDGGSVTVFGVDSAGNITSDVFTPLAAQPLIAAEDVDGAVDFATVTSITKTNIAGAGTAAVGLRDSRFITIDEIGSYNLLGVATLSFLTGTPRLNWNGALSDTPIPVDGQYVLPSQNLPARFYGLVPQPAGGYIVGDDHFLLFEGNDLGAVLIDLSNESYAGPGFNGGASPRTQVQVETTINDYFARDTRYGAVRATGTITCPSGAVVAPGDIVTLNDFVNGPLDFEFQIGPPAVAAPGNIVVAYLALDTDDVIAAKLAAAINNGYNADPGGGVLGAAGALRISASSAANVVAVQNNFGGTQGNGLGFIVVPGTFSKTGMAGGVNAPFWSFFATAVSGFFMDALRLQTFLTGLTGAAAAVRLHPTGASGMQQVMGVPRYAAPLTAVAGVRSVALTVGAGMRFPAVAEPVILNPAFADTVLQVSPIAVQPASPQAIEIFFSAAWRAVTLRVTGLDVAGAVLAEDFAPTGALVASGVASASLTGILVTLGGGETFAGVEVGMFFRRTDTGDGAYVRFVRASSIILSVVIPGSPWVGIAWQVTKDIIAKGTNAFASVAQIDRLSAPVAGTSGTATLSIIDGALHGYEVRVGRGLRVAGVGGDITVSDPLGAVADFAAAFTSELDDIGGAVHLQLQTEASGTNVGLHQIYEFTGLGAGDTAFNVRHQDFDRGGRFDTESPLPGTWRIHALGNLVRVVGYTGGVLTLYPPGVPRSHAIGALVELATEMPTEQRGVDGPRTLTVTVDRALTPTVLSSDALTITGSTVPDGWRIFGNFPTQVLDIPGYLETQKLFSQATGIIDWSMQHELREMDVRTYRGFLLRTQFLVQMHSYNSGTGDSVTAGPVVTLTDAAGAFNAGMVGGQILVFGSTFPGTNNGFFIITAFISPTQIQFANAVGVAEVSPFAWRITSSSTGRDVIIEYSFDGAAFVAGSAVPGSAAANPQYVAPSMYSGGFSGGPGPLDPRLSEAQLEIPAGAEECIIRLRIVATQIGDTISIERCSVIAVPSMGLFLGSGTVPLSPHQEKFGEVLYVWSPELLNTSERRGLSVGEDLSLTQPTTIGTIDRVVNAHGVWDRYDVSEYAGLPAVNLVGAYTDLDWLAGSLSNMVIDVGTPARATVVKPVNVSLLEETLAFTPATSLALLAETSAHEGTLLGPKGTALLAQVLTVQTLTDADANFPLAIVGTTVEVRGAIHAVNNGFFVITARPSITSISWINASGLAEPSFLGTYRVRVLFPEESFVEEQLLEDDVPVPATPSVVGGVLPWRFQAGSVLDIASASSGDPPAQQIFNAAATYVLSYRRLTRATTGTIDLGAAFADYRWLVDPAIYRRRNPASSTFARTQSLTFAADFTAPLDVPSDEDETTTVLVRDNGLVRTELSVSSWRYVDQSTISIDSGEFDADSIFSLTYQALEPNYPAPANIVVEHRSAAALVGLATAPWVIVQVDDLVNTVRYHQLRVTIDGIVDVRDVEVAGLGLRGLHLYGAAPFAPGII